GTGQKTDAFGVTLAFNTIGWASQNILFNAIDALIGDPAIANAFGGEIGGGATATMTDTPVNADGQGKVDAFAQALINSSINNETTAGATGVMGRKGTALGAVLSMNKVSSVADATGKFTGSNLSTQTISAGNGVTVSADDSARITAITTLVSETKFN